MLDSSMVIVGPKLIYQDGAPQATGARLRWTDGSFEVLDHEQLACADDDQRDTRFAHPATAETRVL